MTKLKENGHQSEEDPNMQVRMKIKFLTRDPIQLRKDMDSSKVDLVVSNHCNVGYV